MVHGIFFLPHCVQNTFADLEDAKVEVQVVSLKMDAPCYGSAIRNGDVVAAGFENALALFEHDRHVQESHSSAEQSIDS